MSEFSAYRQKSISEMRPYIQGENLEKVSISVIDIANGSPLVGDMIVRNPNNHKEQWLISEQYFKDNLEGVVWQS